VNHIKDGIYYKTEHSAEHVFSNLSSKDFLNKSHMQDHIWLDQMTNEAFFANLPGNSQWPMTTICQETEMAMKFSYPSNPSWQ